MTSLMAEAGSFWEEGIAAMWLLYCHYLLQPTRGVEVGGSKTESASPSCEACREVYVLWPCPHLPGKDPSLGHVRKEQKTYPLGTSPHPPKMGACLTSLKW